MTFRRAFWRALRWKLAGFILVSAYAFSLYELPQLIGLPPAP